VEDVRDEDGIFTLEGSGFMFIHHQSQFRLTAKDFESSHSSSRITSYLEETMDLVKRELGSTKAILYDWRVSKAYKITEASCVINICYYCSSEGTHHPLLRKPVAGERLAQLAIQFIVVRYFL